MKFEKKDLNSLMLFKLRGYGLCVAMLRNEFDGERYVLYNKEHIDKGNDSGSIAIEEYDNNLCENARLSEYDIISIKQFKSTNTVLKYVMNNIEPEEWDWTEEDEIKEKETKINEIDSYVKSSFEKLGISLEGKYDKVKELNEVLYKLSETWNEYQ